MKRQECGSPVRFFLRDKNVQLQYFFYVQRFSMCYSEANSAAAFAVHSAFS
jgi:hypothetical protein